MPRDTVKGICNRFMNWGKEELYTSNRSLYTHEDTLRSGDNMLYMGKVVAARYKKSFMTENNLKAYGNKFILVNQSELPSSTTTARHYLFNKARDNGAEAFMVMDPMDVKQSHTLKIDSWYEELERLRKSRSSRQRINMVGVIHEVADTIHCLERCFDIIGRAKLEIPENLIPKLCMWRMDGEPIMENWKNLLDKLNGERNRNTPNGNTKNNDKAA